MEAECPSVDEWGGKYIYIHTHSRISLLNKKGNLAIFYNIMEGEGIRLSEIHQTKTNVV